MSAGRWRISVWVWVSMGGNGSKYVSDSDYFSYRQLRGEGKGGLYHYPRSSPAARVSQLLYFVLGKVIQRPRACERVNDPDYERSSRADGKRHEVGEVVGGRWELVCMGIKEG